MGEHCSWTVVVPLWLAVVIVAGLGVTIALDLIRISLTRKLIRLDEKRRERCEADGELCE